MSKWPNDAPLFVSSPKVKDAVRRLEHRGPTMTEPCTSETLLAAALEAREAYRQAAPTEGSGRGWTDDEAFDLIAPYEALLKAAERHVGAWKKLEQERDEWREEASLNASALLGVKEQLAEAKRRLATYDREMAKLRAHLAEIDRTLRAALNLGG